MGIYNYIERIDKQSMFIFVFLGMIVSHIVFRNTTAGLVGSVAIGLVVIYYMADKDVTVGKGVNDKLKIKLMKLKLDNPRYPLDNLHKDIQLVDLLYNVREYKDYNYKEYKKAIKAADDFIQISEDIKTGTYHCQENIDVAADMSKLLLNHIHSVIYKLPPGKVSIEKFDRFLKELEHQLAVRIDQLKDICRKYYEKGGMDYHVKFPIEGPGQLPLDKDDRFQYFT